MKDSITLYKKAIKVKYDESKAGRYSVYLLSPTSAKLRELCIMKYKEGRNKDDLDTFKDFFGFDFDSNNIQKMKNETDKFRPLQTFLKGETELSDYNNGADMLAVILDLEERPYANFLRKLKTGGYKKPKGPTIKTGTSPINWKLIAASVLLIVSFSFTAKSIWFPNQQCMQWKEKHYEMIDCNATGDNIIAYNENTFKLKKIEVNEKTPFFHPLVWYSKQNNHIECFINGPGKHPVTGNKLRKISKTIILNYIAKDTLKKLADRQ